MEKNATSYDPKASWLSLEDSSQVMMSSTKIEDMAYLMILRKLLIHQSVFINDLITLKESAKELVNQEMANQHDFSFSSPGNIGTDVNMYDLHQALRSYDDNNKLILQNFTEAILKRYETEDKKEEMRKKLLQMVQLKRRHSHSKDALQLIQSMEQNS